MDLGRASPWARAAGVTGLAADALLAAADAARAFPASTAEEALQSVTDLAGDQFIGYSTWKWLDVHGRTSGQPVYRYLYARPRPAPPQSSAIPSWRISGQ